MFYCFLFFQTKFSSQDEKKKTCLHVTYLTYAAAEKKKRELDQLDTCKRDANSDFHLTWESDNTEKESGCPVPSFPIFIYLFFDSLTSMSCKIENRFISSGVSDVDLA